MTEAVSNIFGDLANIWHAMEHKKIIDNLTVATFIVDAELNITYLNPAAEEFLSTGVRNAMRRKLGDFILDDENEFLPQIQQSILSGHPFTQREVCIKHVHGGENTIDCAVTPILSKDKSTECLLEIIKVDRLLRIAREEHLLNETQATQNMLRGIAHEIKNPLGGLRGAAQLLAGELDDAELTEYTDVIISEADRLGKLVDRMFGPNITPSKKDINVHDVLEHIRYLASAEANNEISFQTDYDPSIPNLYADQDMLVQAVLNIVRNSINAMQGNGEIQLKTRVLRKYTLGDTCHRLVVQISVIDNGPGVPDELKQQIFFPMVSGNENGTGLGLPISQNLINLHDGLIEFDSVPMATEFKILLPLNSEENFTSA